MITYIAIYMGVGLVVAAYVAWDMSGYCGSLTLKELAEWTGCCLIAWPMMLPGVLLSLPRNFPTIEKLLNKVVIKRKK